MKWLQAALIYALPFYVKCSNISSSASANAIVSKSSLIDLSALDDILVSKDKTVLGNFFSEMGRQTIESYAARIFLKVISKGNVVAYETLVELGADPFKVDEEYKMSAFDFVTVISAAEISPGQTEIKTKIEKKWRESPGMEREADAVNSMADKSLLFLARVKGAEDFVIEANARNQANPLTMTFSDRSRPIHQVIIGNNTKLLGKLLDLSDVNRNELWIKGDAEPDIKKYGSIDPVGWTPLMLAVAFNRDEMVRALLTKGGINLGVKSGKYDVFYLARRLPIAMRSVMLPILRAALPAINSGVFANLKAAIEGGASNDSINYHLDQSGAMTIDVLKAAVTHLTDENTLKTILSEDEKLFEQKAIHKSLWEALKLDKKTKTVEGFKRKLEILTGYGFKVDERQFYVEASGGMTPMEEVYQSNSVSYELSVGAVLFSKQVNSLNVKDKKPIVFALESGKVQLVKYLLKNAGDLKLNLDIEVNEFKENLLHYVLTLDIIKDGDLLEIVKLLLELKPQFLNSQSISTSKNEVSYTLDGKPVKYSVLKRSKWTPLMYAVMMRRNAVARYLVERGADKNLTGWDGVNVDEIIKARCDAYNQANPPPPPSVDTVKEEYNKKARERIIASIITEMDRKYSY